MPPIHIRAVFSFTVRPRCIWLKFATSVLRRVDDEESHIRCTLKLGAGQRSREAEGWSDPNILRTEVRKPKTERLRYPALTGRAWERLTGLRMSDDCSSRRMRLRGCCAKPRHAIRRNRSG